MHRTRVYTPRLEPELVQFPEYLNVNPVILIITFGGERVMKRKIDLSQKFTLMRISAS